MQSGITVKEGRARGRDWWIVDVPASFLGKRKRKYFGSEGGALQWADEFERDVLEKGSVAVLEGGKTVAEVLKRFWLSKSFQGHHERLAKFYLVKFEAFRGRSLFQGLKPEDIELFWGQHKWSGTSRLQSLRYLHLFFDWAQRYGFADRNIATKVEKPKSDSKPRRILTPYEMKRLLRYECPVMRAFLAAGGFAGLRTSEFLQDPVIHPKHVFVTGKTGARYVDILPAFRRHFPRGVFKSPDERTFRRRRAAMVEEMGWKEWPDNCLRHSFATYHLAANQNAPMTAFQMGHSSPQMVSKVYAKPALTAVARAWWRL